jgi:hypothetical protein
MLGALFGFLAAGAGAKADALCDEQGKMAEMIMQARQDGVAKKAAMDFANRGDELIRPMVRELVRLAYAKPLMKTKQARRKLVGSFAVEIERDCRRDVDLEE